MKTHILVPLLLEWVCASSLAEDFDPARLEREVLAADLYDGIQLQVAPSGYVYFIERGGALTSEARVVLHDRKHRAALYDDAHQLSVLEVFTLKRSRRVCTQLSVGVVAVI